MDIITSLILIGYGGFFIISIILFVWMLGKRLDEKKTEKFDDRDN